jgi:hypothetical protein
MSGEKKGTGSPEKGGWFNASERKKRKKEREKSEGSNSSFPAKEAKKALSWAEREEQEENERKGKENSSVVKGDPMVIENSEKNEQDKGNYEEKLQPVNLRKGKKESSDKEDDGFSSGRDSQGSTAKDDSREAQKKKEDRQMVKDRRKALDAEQVQLALRYE